MDEFFVDSVQHSFDGRPVLNNVYLKCGVGEVVGVLGRNGCGKSTLLKIIFGTISPHYKHLRIDDKIVSKGFLTGEFAYLSQSFFIPHYLKLGVVVKLYTNKYQNLLLKLPVFRDNLNEKIGSLSGGYRRLAETLLMIYSDAKYVLLDEPFSQLSPFLIEEIKTNINLMLSYKGFVITDHYYQHVLNYASRTILLHNGCNYNINNLDDLRLHGYLPSMLH
ncbi:ATP-binding cassette domain-containing protein [Pedobacter ureilyticus]|uniref:ATP-binding cassette domain-containing protein n=1 Tax=Pedobacter ureilyticus TaxID=1393051 RepID=A0ABW9JB54_9SPHI|nr:ABC transporter ATP-binding protein [Pedobacter helvus]